MLRDEPKQSRPNLFLSNKSFDAYPWSIQLRECDWNCKGAKNLKMRTVGWILQRISEKLARLGKDCLGYSHHINGPLKVFLISSGYDAYCGGKKRREVDQSKISAGWTFFSCWTCVDSIFLAVLSLSLSVFLPSRTDIWFTVTATPVKFSEWLVWILHSSWYFLSHSLCR